MYTQAIAYHAANTPDRIAIEASIGIITYGRFENDINRIANALRPSLPAGPIVGVQHIRPYYHWLLTLALARLGRCSVSLPPKNPKSNFGARSVLVDDPAYAVQGADSLLIDNNRIQDILTNGDIAPVIGSAGPDDPARIAISSGTSGIPKSVSLTHGIIVSRMRSGIFGSAMRFDPRVFCQLPTGTFGGFGMPMRTWYMGGTVILGSLPMAKLVSGEQLTAVMSPAVLHEIVLRLPPRQPLEKLTIVVGGAVLPEKIARLARERLTENIVLTYGSTETTTVATARIQLTQRDPGLTGIVLPWVTVEIVDDEDRPLPAGAIGTVRIRCEGMVHAYVDDPKATKVNFRHGWFYPGDVGRLGPKKEIYIIGRTDDVMNLNGNKVAPEAVEAAIMACDGVEDAAVTSVVDDTGFSRIIALIVPADGFAEDIVRRAVQAKFQVGDFPIRIVMSIPRNDLGKVERYKLPMLLDAAPVF